MDEHAAADTAHLTDAADLEAAAALREDVSGFYRRLRSERADHKLSPTQLQALGHLQREGSMTARELADFEQVTPQSIARTLGLLEDAGMVSRVRDPHDARASVVSITELGRHTLAEDNVLRSRWLADLLATGCTPHERDVLLLAGRILRELTPRGPRS